MERAADGSRARREMGCAATLLWLAWAIATLMFSIHVIGARLFLVYVYGWSRVHQEHLRILDMPKGDPWPVSNGDMIAHGHFVHFLISGACWLALFFTTATLFLRAMRWHTRRAPA